MLSDQQLIRKYFPDRAICSDLATIENDNAIAELNDELDIVSRYHLCPRKLPQYPTETTAGSRIEIGEGFVQHEHLWMTGQNSSEAHSLPFAGT